MKIINCFVINILKLRYTISINGEKELNHNGPILILPNHIAIIDPIIILAFLGKNLDIFPIASEKHYNKFAIKQIMDLMGTIPIGEVEIGVDTKKIKNIFNKVVAHINLGKNILLYPSGQIYRQGFESIKGKQATYNIINLLNKNIKIVAVRNTGLWGSISSMAWDNGNTGIFKLIFKYIWYIFSNLIFFIPKRKINIELVDITKDINFYKNKSLNEFNLFLENFYNKKGEEKINYIKHYFYYDDVKNKKQPEFIGGSFKELNNIKEYDLSDIDNNIKEKILNKIAIQKEVQILDIHETTNLVLDLYFDSLDLAELKSFIQANFNQASNPPIGDLKTVGDLIIMAVGKSENTEKLKECRWNKFNFNGDLIKRINFNGDKNILNLWKQNFKNNKYEDFFWDNIFGKQTKRDFLIKAYFISSRIKKIKGDYIGVMMPAIGAANLLIISIYLAGKIPVMFNWTLGKDGFDHCVKFSKVESIISVSSFYDKVKNDFLEKYNYQGKFIFLENLLKDGKIFEKILALIKSFYIPIKNIKKENNAVILFTSGSESLPKAVALTHENLIENIIGSIKIFKIKDKDILLGFLPPFHSFGFTINAIMPLITAFRVVYTPDPNDAKTILNIIKHTNITVISATPTFLKMIMNLASGDDFKYIKYVVVGAEKCPNFVFEKFKKLCPKGKILEGYGITECSPVIGINPIEGPKPGTVGKIIDCLECIIINIDSSKECKTGEQGMIYIKGKSIFNGYLDDKIENPFEEINEKKYYKTGDLGFLDKDGFLTITGRIKRFIKIAGEMISLPFIEGILFKKYGNSEELKIAIEALEKDGNTKIVLFSLDDLQLEEVNEYMRNNGVPNLVKISEIIKIEQIPLLGTGKIDYKILKKMINF